MANKSVIDEAQSLFKEIYSKPPSKAYKHIHTWAVLGAEMLLPIKTLYDYEGIARRVLKTFKLK